MRIMQQLTAAAFVLCAVAAVLAQDLPAKAGRHVKETAHLTVTTSASQDAVAPGTRLSLMVDVAPKPKMHVYAPGQEGYIAITLTLDPDPAFTAGKATYPAGEKILIKILNETQLVYAKPFRIAQDVTLRRGSGQALASTPEMRRRATDGASLTIKGALRYQACDDKICYLPVNMPLAWTLKLAAIQ